MEKGSPEGYNAETGLLEPAQKPQTGEPHERQPLYRIRRTQEKHQLLREDLRREDRRGRQAAGDARRAAPVGRRAAGALAWRDGSDAVQRLDLRHVATVCGRAADGAPGFDESHRRIQEEERQAGRAEDRRHGALRLTAGVLCGAGGDPRSAAVVALSQPGGRPGRAHEEQDERVVDGSGRGVQQTATAREAILHEITGHFGRGAGIGERSAAAKPGRDGDVRDDAAAIAGQATQRPAAGPAGDAAEEHSGRGASDGADLDSGGRRSAPVLFRGARGELLRADFGVGFVGRQAAARTDFETTQCAFTDGVGRSGETGAAVESAVGGGTRAGAGTRESQPGHPGRSTKAGGVSAGGGQIRPAVRDPQYAGGRNGGTGSGIKKRSQLTSGKGCFPTQAARRGVPDSRTVLAVKGSLRRAINRRALDPCGPFCQRHSRDGRLRRENNHSLPCAAQLRFASDPPAVPRLGRTAPRRVSLPMCHFVCFEAGRFTQTQSSWTDSRCSRKWMSGHADALAEFVTDRKKQIVGPFGRSTTALQEALPSAGEVLFSLDKPLSWMSHRYLVACRVLRRALRMRRYTIRTIASTGTERKVPAIPAISAPANTPNSTSRGCSCTPRPIKCGETT